MSWYVGGVAMSKEKAINLIDKQLKGNPHANAVAPLLKQQMDILPALRVGQIIEIEASGSITEGTASSGTFKAAIAIREVF